MRASSRGSGSGRGLAAALVPAAWLLAFVVTLVIVHEGTWALGRPWLTRAAGHVSFVLFLLATNFGALPVYVSAHRRGAKSGARVAAALLTPIACVVFEVVRVSEFFTPAESLYYGLCPTNLSMLAGNVGAMGVGELVCRALDRTAGGPVRVWTAGPVVALATYAVAFYVFSLWGGGGPWFYVYMRGYVLLFS